MGKAKFRSERHRSNITYTAKAKTIVVGDTRQEIELLTLS